jgi:hypothetical protein
MAIAAEPKEVQKDSTLDQPPMCRRLVIAAPKLAARKQMNTVSSRAFHGLRAKPETSAAVAMAHAQACGRSSKKKAGTSDQLIPCATGIRRT